MLSLVLPGPMQIVAARSELKLEIESLPKVRTSAGNDGISRAKIGPRYIYGTL